MVTAEEALCEVLAKMREVEAGGFTISGELHVQDDASIRDGRRRGDLATWYPEDGDGWKGRSE